MRPLATIVGLAVGVLLANPAAAQEAAPEADAGARTQPYQGTDPLGGPADIPNQIRFDAAMRESLTDFDPLERWFAWKERLTKRTGLRFQINYNVLAMSASDSLGESNAAGGVFELNGTWDLFNRHCPNKGILGFRVEHRHKLGTDIAPAGLGAEIGSLWRPDVLWSERALSLSQLWWEQRFYGGRGAVRFGKLITPAVLYDVFLLRVPQLAIQSEPFTFSATPFPDNGLGVTAVIFPRDCWYVQAGIHDAKAFIEDTGFDTVFDGEYFKALEIGWTPEFAKRKTDNFHVTLWHVDRLKETGRPEGWGGTVSFQRYFCDQWLPFARYSHAANEVLPIKHLFQGGIGYRLRDHDSVALGLSYAKPSDITLRDQWGLEAYYRVHVTRALSVIPGFQLIVNPSRNLTTDSIAVFSIRARISL